MWEGCMCALSHAAHSKETSCLIPFLTMRFTLWTNKGNAIIMSTTTLYLKNKISAGRGKLFLGGDSRPPHCTLCMKPCE